jgi:hypothetical protein
MKCTKRCPAYTNVTVYRRKRRKRDSLLLSQYEEAKKGPGDSNLHDFAIKWDNVITKAEKIDGSKERDNLFGASESVDSLTGWDDYAGRSNLSIFQFLCPLLQRDFSYNEYNTLANPTRGSRKPRGI